MLIVADSSVFDMAVWARKREDAYLALNSVNTFLSLPIDYLHFSLQEHVEHEYPLLHGQSIKDMLRVILHYDEKQITSFTCNVKWCVPRAIDAHVVRGAVIGPNGKRIQEWQRKVMPLKFSVTHSDVAQTIDMSISFGKTGKLSMGNISTTELARKVRESFDQVLRDVKEHYFDNDPSATAYQHWLGPSTTQNQVVTMPTVSDGTLGWSDIRLGAKKIELYQQIDGQMVRRNRCIAWGGHTYGVQLNSLYYIYIPLIEKRKNKKSYVIKHENWT